MERAGGTGAIGASPRVRCTLVYGVQARGRPSRAYQQTGGRQAGRAIVLPASRSSPAWAETPRKPRQRKRGFGGEDTGRAVERGSAKGGRQPEPTKLRNQSYRHLFGEKGDGVNDTNGALPSLSTRYSHCARIAPKSGVEIAR